MPKLKIKQTKEQIFAKNKWNALTGLAERAGFDEDALVYAEFGLMTLFEMIVEQCAQVAEYQSTVYSDGGSGKGAMDAANAIRTYGKMLGNREERKSIISPTKDL